jgi:hypothetical protein
MAPPPDSLSASESTHSFDDVESHSEHDGSELSSASASTGVVNSSSSQSLSSPSSSSMDWRLSWICDQVITHLSVDQLAFDRFWHHVDARSQQATHANAVIHFLDVGEQGATLLLYTVLEEINRGEQCIHLSTANLSDQVGRFRTIYIMKNHSGEVKKPKDEEEVRRGGTPAAHHRQRHRY